MQLRWWTICYGVLGAIWILLTISKNHRVTTEVSDCHVPIYFDGVSVKMYRISTSCDGIRFCDSEFGWLRFVDFFKSHAGKEIVKRINFNAGPAVYKSKFARDPQSHSHEIASAISGIEDTVSPFRFFCDWILANYSPFVPIEFLHQFHDLELGELEDIFHLLQQNEFFYLSLNRFASISQNHFVNLLGSCGFGYITEMVPEVLDRSFVLMKSWSEILPVVNSFLDLSEELNKNGLHLCDVQLSNFGWDATSGHVKILDLDVAFFEKLLSDQFKERPCRSAKDCVLFDCHASCDFTKNICEQEVLDNNLARICKDIFQPGFMQPGLFSFFPLEFRAKLFQIADKCAKHDPHNFPDMLSEIRTLLLLILESAI